MTSVLAPDRLRRRLAELCTTHNVPGASVAVLHHGAVVEAAFGVTSTKTGVEATTDTVFHFGSVTKAWVSTVVMALVEEGVLSLDVPIRAYLPDFRVADPDVTEKVTLRHLLSHSSGIEGEHFVDLGRGDDVLERYVETCAALPQVHPLGASMSYNNTGFAIAGRVLEVVTGRVWDQVMRERLFGPLGLSHTGTLPEEAILHRVAVGHLVLPGGQLFPAPQWQFPRMAGPMGTVHGTAAELVAFGRLHAENGVTPGGWKVLAPESVLAMREEQVRIPDPYTVGQAWGLGWVLFDGEPQMIGHDGGTIGQTAFLRIVPDGDVVVALLTNVGGENAQPLYRALCGEILEELTGITLPKLPEPPAVLDLDLSPYAGTYERMIARVTVRVEGDRLVGHVETRGPMAGMEPDYEFTAVPVDEHLFLMRRHEADPPTPLVFFDFVDGRPGALHSALRMVPRVD